MSNSDVEFDRNNKLVTSWLFSPLVLGSIRLAIAIYALATLLVALIWPAVRLDEDSGEFFSFFTNLTFIGICAYFFASGVQTIFFALKGREGSTEASYPLKGWPRFLRYLHVLLLTTVTTYPILVTIVFWILLASSETFATTFSSWSNISKHALNAVFALFEIIFTNIAQAPWIDLPVTIVILAMYLGLAYLTKATQGFYHPKKQGAKLAAYIIGILVGHIIVFVVVFGAIKLRERLTKGKGETSGGKGLLTSDTEKRSTEGTNEAV
ncbi:hypothetical protein CVT24_008059 [Panaeolus cyanescens]|uniref:FAR-17a/AIG1-like protein n=1 Tax=Panaeolus cyanescens TaxID=181874 RepID=A0A409W098_9AGAR|nr:hypothetical protein CVT24_008059 [Panaeolus cyanescens]